MSRETLRNREKLLTANYRYNALLKPSLLPRVTTLKSCPIYAVLTYFSTHYFFHPAWQKCLHFFHFFKKFTRCPGSKSGLKKYLASVSQIWQDTQKILNVGPIKFFISERVAASTTQQNQFLNKRLFIKAITLPLEKILMTLSNDNLGKKTNLLRLFTKNLFKS